MQICTNTTSLYAYFHNIIVNKSAQPYTRATQNCAYFHIIIINRSAQTYIRATKNCTYFHTIIITDGSAQTDTKLRLFSHYYWKKVTANLHIRSTTLCL